MYTCYRTCVCKYFYYVPFFL